MVYILSLFLLCLYIGLFVFYNKLYNQQKSKNYKSNNYSTKISVIIPARNEAENISACIDGILAQQYPKQLLEIIAINDGSTDDTALVLQQYTAQIKILTIAADEKGGKKQALSKGIAAATGELILCTDADCIQGQYWVAQFAGYFEKTTSAFIAGPVKLQPKDERWSLVNIFQTIDFITLQGITAAVVNKGLHMMSNGANMAFTKAAFMAVNGFDGIDAIATGDDMLLMQKIKDKFPDKVGYLKNKEAIVTSHTVGSWAAFIKQRIRWSSKASYYTDKKLTYTLLLVYTINVAVLLLLLSLFLMPENWLWVTIFIGLKAIVEFSFYKKSARFFGQSNLNYWFWPLIPLHLVYIIIAGWFGKFGKVAWKGR